MVTPFGMICTIWEYPIQRWCGYMGKINEVEIDIWWYCL